MSKSLWFTFDRIKKHSRAFNFVFGGRGTGKTFNAIAEQVEENREFVFMRRTQTEIELLASGVMGASLSPFKSVNSIKNTELEMYRINKNVYGIRNGFDEEHAKFMGFGLALSTVSSLRGFDGSDIKDIIFDEFVPQKDVRLIKDEGGAFFNAYETINRNREFSGDEPVRAYLLSNSNNISHPLITTLGISSIIERMIKKGQTFVDLPQRNMTITMIRNAEFEDKKRNTALYQLTKGTSFYEMALHNDFAYDDFSGVRNVDLRAYTPWVRYGSIMLYRHKTEQIYFASTLLRKTRHSYDDTDSDTLRFYQDYGRTLYGMFLEHRLYFENYAVKKRILEVVL